MKNQLKLSLLVLLCPVLMHAQWIEQSTGFTTPSRGLWDISIADENTVWVLAYDGTQGINTSAPEFSKTTDGGATWTPGAAPAGYHWSNIIALDSETAWIAAGTNGFINGAIFKTTDGGTTWNEQGVGVIFNSTSIADFVHFWNANEGVAVGDPNPDALEIYTSSDGGENWSPVPAKNIPPILAGEYGPYRYITLGNEIWFNTNKYRVYHSSDKGLTWSVSNTGIPVTSSIDYIDIAFWNVNEGIARKYNQSTNTTLNVVRTNDGGATWNPVTVTGPLFGTIYSGIAYVPGTTSTLVSTSVHPSGRGSSYSNDGGTTWTLIDSTIGLYITRFFDHTTGWSANFNLNDSIGGIFKYSGDLVGVKNTENGKDISFTAYPNPSSGHITVQLFNGENAELKISIYDLGGKVVYHQDYGVPGEFFMRGIDLSKLIKGAYILRIENGILNHSEKIILK